jgi:AraC-like DNA-binding protein
MNIDPMPMSEPERQDMHAPREPAARHVFAAGRPSHTVFQLLRLDDVRAAERFDYWQEMVIQGADLTRTATQEHPVFNAWIMSLGTPTGEFHHGHADPYITRRQPRHIRRDDSEELALYWVMEGSISQRQDHDRDARVVAGEFFLFNMARASECSLARCKLTQIDISPQILRTELGTIPAPRLVTEALRSSKLTSLLKHQLALLPGILGGMSETERAVSLRATENLAIAVLKGALLEAPGAAVFDANDHSHAQALFVAACRFIDRELKHPALDVAMVTNALRCSRASLYRAFALNQQSVRKYIRQTRLARLRQLLECSPPGLSIGALAARCGLYDPQNVNRMFREAFSIAPSDVRREAAAGRDGMAG